LEKTRKSTIKNFEGGEGDSQDSVVEGRERDAATGVEVNRPRARRGEHLKIWGLEGEGYEKKKGDHPGGSGGKVTIAAGRRGERRKLCPASAKAKQYRQERKSGGNDADDIQKVLNHVREMKRK